MMGATDATDVLASYVDQLRSENATLRRVADEQTARLIEAGEQHLADEQSIRNMERRIAKVEAERDALLAAIKPKMRGFLECPCVECVVLRAAVAACEEK